MDNLKNLLIYDESSPSCLRWLCTVKRYGGKPAGSSTSNNRWQLIINGRNLLAHRVIWFLFHGELKDDLQIDHIDGNSLNNNINNLRAVIQDINARNCKQRCDNTSGVVGVSYVENVDNRGKNPSVCRRWVAQWCKDNRRMSKSFSINKYGYAQAFKLACTYRQQMIDSLNNEGAGYTDRHGKGI